MMRRTPILSHAPAARILAAALLCSCAGPPDADGTNATDLALISSEAPPWVTLVTGDRVLVTTTGDVPVSSVVPGKGREAISFSLTRSRGHVYVTPSDAAPLIAAGRLDAELFNVSALVAFGYDDTHRNSVPLLLTYGRGAAAARAPLDGATPTRALPSIDGVAIEVGKDAAADAWRGMALGASTAAVTSTATGEIRKVWLDRPLAPALDHSVPQIGAPAAWAAGYTGQGIVIAVLDSGVDDTHPDLAGAIVEQRNFTSDDGTADQTGHGTHVASTIAGSGEASDGRYRGVAPDAHLLIGKVCTANACPMSSVLAGIEWAVVDRGARIVNLSLGGPDTADVDPLEEAIDRLSAERGALFVVAAGNEAAPQTIASPGSAESALTVGAVDEEDALADFSSRGPRLGDGGIKPDLTAPGVGIAAALAAGTEPGEVVDGVYVRLSGTSMATPHVAGAAALLLQQHPDWRGDQLKAALMGSARPNPALTLFEQGAGRLDVAAATAQPIFATPASLNLGIASWPHGDDAPIRRTVTYANPGSAPVTLRLVLEARGPDGEPAPAGLFEVSPAEIALEAQGTTSVLFTANTALSAPDGAYSGQLVATSADGSRRAVPFVLLREAESYDLSLTHLDRDGARTANYETLVARLDDPEETEVLSVYSPDGAAQVRLPKGRYLVYSTITTTRGAAAQRSVLVQPSLSLSAATAVTLDSRAARPIQVAVPRRTAELRFTGAGFLATTPTLTLYTSRTFPAGQEGALGQIGPDAPAAELTAHVNAQFAERGPAGDFVNSPRVYALSWTRSGRFFNGFDRRLRDSDLAVVTANHRTTGTGQRATKFASPLTAGGFTDALTFSLPFERTEYYSAEPNGWSQSFAIPGQQGLGARARYRPGTHGRDVWNAAIFTPAFPEEPSVVRTGDLFSGTLSLFSDSAGHLGDNNATGVTRLLRGGQLLGERRSPGRVFFDVDPAAATYRLETEAARSSTAVSLSTRVTAAWTFRSVHTDVATALPLLAIRFAPPLDDQNRAPAGVPFLLPVSVTHMAGAPRSKITTLSVEASYDDGVTWQPAPPLHVGPTRLALLLHPARASFVSLRATAADTTGSRVEEMVIRAYALRR